MVQLSISESIQRLKAEIIAQDWGLSEKRIDLLEAAFACLKQRFKSRKAAHAILIMAGSVLDYVKRKGENTPSDSIDFLKEAMAHVVNLYEEDDFVPENDEKLFKSLYFRFNTLKKKIKTEKEEEEHEKQVVAEPPGGMEQHDSEFIDHVPENIAQLKQKVSELHEVGSGLNTGNFDQLVQELQVSLERAEYVGETIRQLLGELLSAGSREKHIDSEGQEPRGKEEHGQHLRNEEKRDDAVYPEEEEREKYVSSVKSCPVTELREIDLAGTSVFIQESAVALIRDLPPVKLKEYLKDSNVPLKDFAGFFRGLAKQFKGALANISDKKLKKLSLPIMVPSGLSLSDMPDVNATKLVVVTNGHWNGVFLCSAVGEHPVTMVKFKKAKNGDFVGIGYTEDDEELYVLNCVSVLRREGFLTMV